MPKRADPGGLTLADLVVLALLAEQPVHGYAALAELQRREVQDWAALSRPQLYYSLKKLAGAGLIEPARDEGPAQGPERTVYHPSRRGRRALQDALARTHWATQRPPPPFLTWLVLSIHARPDEVRALVRRRHEFLGAQIARERTTLDAIRADTGPTIPIAEAIVELALSQFELERAWLQRVERLLPSQGTSTQR